MERLRQAVTDQQQGRGLPQLEEERMHGAGGQEYGRESGGRGGARPGELPGLQTEEGWERKEGGGRGYGEGGYGEGWAGEEETGVPAGTRGREKMPADMNDFWQDWKFGLTYNNEEWGCVLWVADGVRGWLWGWLVFGIVGKFTGMYSFPCVWTHTVAPSSGAPSSPRAAPRPPLHTSCSR